MPTRGQTAGRGGPVAVACAFSHDETFIDDATLPREVVDRSRLRDDVGVVRHRARQCVGNIAVRRGDRVVRILRLLRFGATRVAKVQTRVRRLPADQQELRGPVTMQGYNFTERVRKVLALAREEVARLHHEYVGTEHVLLAVL